MSASCGCAYSGVVRSWPNILPALVIIFSLFSLGSGYVAFISRAHAGFNGWDVAFALSVTIFLVLLIHLIISFASATISPPEKAEESRNTKKFP
jgi:hypothetical protein